MWHYTRDLDTNIDTDIGTENDPTTSPSPPPPPQPPKKTQIKCGYYCLEKFKNQSHFLLRKQLLADFAPLICEMFLLFARFQQREEPVV